MKGAVSETDWASTAQELAPRTVAELTYHRLRQDILWGQFAPGLPLRSENRGPAMASALVRCGKR